MNALSSGFRRGHRFVAEPSVRAAVEHMTYELVPLKSLPEQVGYLPEHARVSITASPVKPIEQTLDACARLIDAGHRPVPHLAARMVEDPVHLRRIATRCKDLGLSEIFCIAGDAETHGAYPDTMSLLRELLDIATGEITAVGVAGYPDGHAFIDDASLHAALMDKQDLFASAGVAGHAVTQMCFSADAIRRWTETERARGLEMPLHLGVPGVVDRTKLMSMGLRLGVGTSLRYLKKNRAGLVRLFASTGYNPSSLIDPLARDFTRLDIESLHAFTFNQVAATRAWQRTVLG